MIAAVHEARDVVGVTVEAAICHRVDELVGLEGVVQISSRPVKFDSAVSEEFDVGRISVRFAV